MEYEDIGTQSDCTYFSPAEKKLSGQNGNLMDFEDSNEIISITTQNTDEQIHTVLRGNEYRPEQPGDESQTKVVAKMDNDCRDKLKVDLHTKEEEEKRELTNNSTRTETFNSKLTNKQSLTEMNEGSTEMNEGSTEMNEDSTEMNEGLTEMNEGSTEMNEGLTEMNEGSTEMNEDSTEMNEDSTEMNEGLTEINTSSTDINKSFVKSFSTDKTHATNVKKVNIGNDLSPEQCKRQKTSLENTKKTAQTCADFSDIEFIRNKAWDELLPLTDEQWNSFGGQEIFGNMPELSD